MPSENLFASALLVEDEIHFAKTLQIALAKLSIPTQHASTISQAKQKLVQNSPELVILDRSLPDGDGLDLCLELRTQHFTGAILVLTAMGHVSNRIQGLNSGADDYLSKPFSWEELEARIRALARRKQNYLFSSLWQLDESRLRILSPRGWVTLTPLEFKLASKLIEKEGTIVSRDFLLKEVWGFTLLPKTRTVDHFLGRLRKYFESNPEEPHHFLTIRGVGYKFHR